MDMVGSRLGRASSRYGPSATAAMFNGLVRKWKKKWIHVHTANTSCLLLCRWTPLSPATAADAASSEEPPKCKFRYTPIAVLEERGKRDKRVDHEAEISGISQFRALQTTKNDGLTSATALETETQGKMGQMKKVISAWFWTS
uniref:Uncharacterized protein n=1 Tax=Manihot esculenta TaxID=3983 RepID=A0A2C9UDT0_MANES